MSAAPKIDPEILDMVLRLVKGMKANGFNNQDIKFKLRKRFEEYEIQAALDNFKELHEDDTDDTVSLKENNDYFGWYEGPKSDLNSHWVRLKTHLKQKSNGWTDEMVHSLDIASTTVVSNLAPPKSEKPICIKGLVLGYIQSGKTANFSAAIAKAVDEGYKLIVVLAGMHNNLRKQTELRLREELVDPSDGKTCTTLTDVDDKGDFKRRQPVSANSQLNRKDGFTFVVLKKNSSVLRNFNSWLSEASEDVIKNCPTIIIDDEADQASINTKKAEQDPTAINNHIRNLIQLFNVVSYVGYTATPFANVFIDSEVSEDLYPKDFLVTLDKPTTYYGTEELFGREAVNGKEATDGLPVIRYIPNDEASHIINGAKNKNLEDSITPSMKDAIYSFILGSAIRLCRGEWKNHMTMLIHFSHLTDPQGTVKSELEEFIEDLKYDLENNNQDLKNILLNLWTNDFSQVTSQILGRLDHVFEKVYKNAIKFTEHLEIILDNSLSDERLTFDRSVRDGEPLWGIVIGGNTLSRGLTLEGLTTSFFIRHSKAYDTLLQMGRWFGYRKGYVDVTRIFVTDTLINNFYNLATLEQEIRDEIRLMANNNEKPIDVALRIRKLPGMIITANNKMRNSIASDLTYSGSKIQTHQLNITDVKILKNNASIIEKLLTDSKNFGKIGKIVFQDLDKCHLFKNVPNETVMQFLDNFFVSENNAKYDKKLIQNYINEINELIPDFSWSVSLMSLKNGKPINVGGFEVIPVRRNVKHELGLESGHIEATLRAVSTPGEELIDLADKVSPAVKNTDDVLKPVSGEKMSDTVLRNKLRPKNRGLIMIYPLDSNLNMSEEEYSKSRSKSRPSYPLRAAFQSYAISIVFPYIKEIQGNVTYMKNAKV